MKTINGSNVIILDGGLVGNNLCSANGTLSHLHSRDPLWRTHSNKISHAHHSGLRNPYKKAQS